MWSQDCSVPDLGCLWRRRRLDTDADTGRIVASALTGNETNGGSPVDALLGRMDDPVARFTGDGAYDREEEVYVYGTIAYF